MSWQRFVTLDGFEYYDDLVGSYTRYLHLPTSGKGIAAQLTTWIGSDTISWHVYAQHPTQEELLLMIRAGAEFSVQAGRWAVANLDPWVSRAQLTAEDRSQDPVLVEQAHPYATTLLEIYQHAVETNKLQRAWAYGNPAQSSEGFPS